ARAKGRAPRREAERGGEKAPRARARARRKAAAAPRRRGARRPQPTGGRRDARHVPAHQGAGPDRDHDRAPHARGHERVRPRRRPRLREKDRRGHAGRGAERPQGDRGVPRRPEGRRAFPRGGRVRLGGFAPQPPTMSSLAVEGLQSGYGEVQILWGASLALAPGKLTTVLGSNGAGKTTLLRTVVGLLPAWKGTVRFDDRDVTRLSAHEKADLGMVLVPEGRQLFSTMSVVENLEMGATCRRARAAAKRSFDQVFTLFPRLAERRGQLAATLSGGEQQMLAIARGLMAKPKILMFDEPSLGLSPLFTMNLFEIIRRLKREGLTMLLVEQNVQMALAVSDYAYVLSHGKMEIE